MHHVNIRVLTMHPAFAGYDPYFTESVMRRASRLYFNLLQELVGYPIEAGYLDGNVLRETPGLAVRYYTPMPDALVKHEPADDAAELPTILMVSETVIAVALFLDPDEPGEATTSFLSLYPEAVMQNDEQFLRNLKLCVQKNPLLVSFGQSLRQLYASGLPTNEQVHALSDMLSGEVARRLDADLPAPVPHVHTPAVPSRDPMSLN